MNLKFVTHAQSNDTVNPHLQSDSECNLDASASTQRGVILERLRQASWSFNVTLAVTVATAIISFTSVGLLLSGNVSVGKVTTAAGLASNVVSLVSLKLAKDANDRLDRIVKELKE